MKTTVNSVTLGTITYEESLWSGKKELFVNNEPLEKINKTQFRTQDGKTVTIKGNIVFGAKLIAEKETVALTKPMSWYEIILALLPFLFPLIWGNSPTLCQIFPVVGGAIGGAVGAFCAILSIIFMKQTDKVLLKIVIGLAALGITVLILYFIALLLSGLMQMI